MSLFISDNDFRFFSACPQNLPPPLLAGAQVTMLAGELELPSRSSSQRPPSLWLLAAHSHPPFSQSHLEPIVGWMPVVQ